MNPTNERLWAILESAMKDDMPEKLESYRDPMQRTTTIEVVWPEGFRSVWEYTDAVLMRSDLAELLGSFTDGLVFERRRFWETTD